MKIHLCIVTEQPLANLIPILQEKPDRIALAVSAPMEAAAERFRNVLQHTGWSKTQVDSFHELPDNNYESIADKALEIEDELRSAYPDAELVYNATGGNKLMTMAFMAVFDSPTPDTNRIIYTDTQHTNIESVRPRQAPTPMASVMSLDVYLKAQGKTLRKRDDADDERKDRMKRRKPLTKFLARNASALEGLIGQINTTFASDNNDSSRLTVLELTRPPKGPWLKALEQMEEHQLIERVDETLQTWSPLSSQGTDYLTGGWLEEYVWFSARDCGAEDVALSPEFTDDYQSNANIRNEIDVTVLHRNRLLMIECKTGNVTRDGKDQDIVYKLDSLVDQVGGRLGKGMLVSFRELEHRTREGRDVNTGARAASVDLLTCEKDGLSRLDQQIQQWLDVSQGG